ncbi:MAG: putative ABC transporter permease [Atopobiaceae bacterium]|nr:putative ABC transporter permease [Atopobiaceae bacterium]
MNVRDNHAPEHAAARPGKPAWRARACVVAILFALFSCAGWIYETVENMFSFGGLYLRASLMLPWCPIYGIGGLVIVAVLEPMRRRLVDRVSPAIQVAAIVVGIYLLTSAVELIGSYACEALMGHVPWDYSHAWLNFQGRIAPMYTLRFVLLGLVALYALYPAVNTWVRRHPHGALVATSAIVALLVCDYALELAGVWSTVKDALRQFGVNHW